MSTTTQHRTVTVVGMTCEHCVASVTEEVGELPGVTGVQVDLATGTVRIESSGALDDARIESAVTEAGYALA